MLEIAAIGRRGNKTRVNVVVRRVRWDCSYFFQPPAAWTFAMYDGTAPSCARE